MNRCEQLIWNDIAATFEWQCPNIAGYIIDHVENPECKGFNIKTLNGITTIQAIGIDAGKRREKFCDLEITGVMPERWNYTHVS